jgi:hypothetical protein
LRSGIGGSIFARQRYYFLGIGADASKRRKKKLPSTEKTMCKKYTKRLVVSLKMLSLPPFLL